MQSHYLEMLEQKDTEIRHLNQKLEDRLQDLITKQETIDTLRHQPAVSKQHLSCDPQLMTELRDKELRLLETKSQLEDSNKEVEKLRRLLEVAEQELRERHEACNTEGDMPNSSKTDGDNGQLSRDFGNHRVEIARLKAEVASAKMENQSAQRRITQLQEELRIVSEARQEAEQEIVLLKEDNDKMSRAAIDNREETERLKREIERLKKERVSLCVCVCVCVVKLLYKLVLKQPPHVGA